MKNLEQEQLYVWLGQRVYFYRKNRKISQTELGTRVGLSRASIVNIERGRQHTPLHILFYIARNLKVSPRDLLPLNDEYLSSDEEQLIKGIEHQKVVKDEESKMGLEDFIKNI